jgi:ubiquinone biosynthesis protein
VQRILVGTDRSSSADRAVRYAADLASHFEAELLLLQVIVPTLLPEDETGTEESARAQHALEGLRLFARELAGDRGRAMVVVDPDPADAICRAAREEGVDTIVVGNFGMSGRKHFLLGNVANRVTHNAPCSVVIADTVSPEDRVVHETREEREARETEPHLLPRAARIGRVMAGAGLRDLFRPGASEEDLRDRAGRLKGAFEKLGPTFGKLGQVLATRPDLLPGPFIDELSTLHSSVPPVSEEEVVAVMEQELGVPWEDIFDQIEPDPIAAGTMAQVHLARLADGEAVVAKVQRPTARADILQDLGLLEMFAEKTRDKRALRSVVDLPSIVEHLSDSLQRELDFGQEAKNAERLREVLRPYSRLDVPKVYTDFSTERLLVMQAIQGVRAVEAPEGPERKEAARQLLESYYRQVLTDGFFHADPHPGNLLWADGKIWFLDVGMVGELGSEVRELLILLIMSFWQQDVAFLADTVLALTGDDQREDLDLAAFQGDLADVVDRYREASLRDIQLGPILQEVTEISVRHQVRLPASLALTGKALAQMQLLVADLDPELDPFSVAGSFLMRDVGSKLLSKANPQKLFYEAQKLKVRATRMIESVERLAGSRPGQKLQVDFRGIDRLEDTLRATGRRLALAIAAGSAFVATSATADSVAVGSWVPVTLGALGGGLTLGLLYDLIFRRRR